MVPGRANSLHMLSNSPRIRGDGPFKVLPNLAEFQFSPYSRGWSGAPLTAHIKREILPVFAGMVRVGNVRLIIRLYSPRIRGDGPNLDIDAAASCNILPVFAGMVPPAFVRHFLAVYSPRIRGDGPTFPSLFRVSAVFSPYSRGWSGPDQCRTSTPSILPVFAGMVP